MRTLARALAVAVMFAALAACGTQPGGALRKGGHHKIRVVIKKDNGVCKSRTIPKHHEVLIPDEDQLIWDIKDRDNCLNAHDLVIKWTSGNATSCAEITTKANGNKTEIKCDLGSGAVAGSHHEYKLYLRDSSNADTLLEDPDVDIVMF